MKKVMRFIKRRICPIMLALVIVFFSVVIPCSKVEAASIAAPVAGYTYFDLVYSLLYSTGFAASMQESDASKSFDKAMYDGFCDYFSMWCYDNLGTADGEEVGEMLRALPDQIVDGTVSVSKTLWEALQSWASDAYDYLSNLVRPSDSAEYVTEDGFITGAYFNAIMHCSYFDSNQVLGSSSYPYYLIGKIAGYKSCNVYLFRYRIPARYFCNVGTEIDYFTSLSSSSLYTTVSTQLYVYPDGSYDSFSSGPYFDSSDGHPFQLISTNMIEITDPSTWLDASVPEYPTDATPDVVWPQQDLAIDKVGSTTWDDAIASDVVVPGEVADTGSIAIDDSIPADSDVIPGTVDVPEEKDDTKDEEKEKEEEEDPADETVTDEEIGTLPDTAAAAGDITKLFPFCIPFDLVALIKGMKAQEKAPVWHFKYYFKDINYTFEFTVDMTDYEKYIKIFRAGIVIFWIIALMFLTIRYSSGIAKD